MSQWIVNCLIAMTLILFKLNHIIYCKSFGIRNSTKDHEAQEQRLALQILSSDQVLAPNDDQSANRMNQMQSFIRNIGYDSSLNQQQSMPRRIVINLNHHHHDPDDSSSERSDNLARLTIGILQPDNNNNDTNPKARPSIVQADNGKSKSRASSNQEIGREKKPPRQQQSSASAPAGQYKRSMRDAIVSSIKNQGGIPAIILQNNDADDESEIMDKRAHVKRIQPAAKFMLNAEMVDRMTTKTANDNNDNNSIEQENQSGGTSTSKEYGEEANGSDEMAGQQQDVGLDQVEPSDNNNHYNRRRPIVGSRMTTAGSSSLSLGSHGLPMLMMTNSPMMKQRSNDELIEQDESVMQNNGALSQRSARSSSPLNGFSHYLSFANSQPSRTESKSELRRGNHLHPVGDDNSAGLRSDGSARIVIALDNQDSGSMPSVASSRRIKDNQKPASVDHMSDRVASLLERLKLYTTRDQLIKVANEMQQYTTTTTTTTMRPTKDNINEEKRDSGLKSDEIPQRYQSGSQSVMSISDDHQKRRSDDFRSRNKIPAPIVQDDNSDIIVTSASNYGKRDEDEENTATGSMFRNRKFDMRTRFYSPDSNSEVSLEPEVNDLGAGDVPDADQREVTEPDGSNEDINRANDDEQSEYANNNDLLTTIEANERSYNRDTTNDQDDAQLANLKDRGDNQEEANQNTDINEIDEIKILEQVIDELVASERQRKQQKNSSQKALKSR